MTPLILGFALFLGVMAVVNLPREEEPQISVPMFDIFVRYPGATSQEVEQRIINVGERKLWEIPVLNIFIRPPRRRGLDCCAF